MAHKIDNITVRRELKPRNEPYWGPRFDKGRHLGVRKHADGLCTWIAKARIDGDQRTRALGTDTEYAYSQARKLADAFFDELDAGVSAPGTATVTDACKNYVETLEDEGRNKTAHDAKKRYERLIYDAPIGKTPLAKLRTAKLRDWRNAVPGTKDTQNRNWEALRAALNLAVADSMVSPTVAQQWRNVKKHKNAKRRRELFLDLKQRRKLLDACSGALRDLVEAAMLTAARPGELVNANRSQFDARTQKMTFFGKTGPRSVPLSPAAVVLFTRCAKGKLPNAPLFPADDGKPWPHSGWDEAFKAAAKKARLPKATVLYSCRHAAITEMLRSGMSTLDCARLSGTSLEMLESSYGHLAESAARERLAQVVML